MKLGKLGVWTIFDNKTAAESAALVKRIEQWGYSAVWMGEAFGRDILAYSAWLLANTSVLNIASGIANIYARDPMAMVGGQLGLNEQSGGRFLLGIGVSHQSIVADMRGHAYGKPIETMRNYLAAMKNAKYFAPLPAEKPKTVLAALGSQMLALSRNDADGAHTYNVSQAHTAQARQILGAERLLCVEQKVILETNPERARDAARKVLALYLSAPNYLNNWRRMGFNDDDFANGGSDRLIDDTVAWGDQSAIIKRIEQHWEAGADHVCIQSIDPNNPTNAIGISNVDEKLLENLARTIG
ncbi:MAG: TIGR03620 family F420-dependent LLM class oxidoreductase [Georgfuchsia sp.]